MYNFDKIFYIDIETVPIAASFDTLSQEMQTQWIGKFDLLSKRMPEKYPTEIDAATGFELSAGIYAEFGKIICISIGYETIKGGTIHLRLKSFAADDEKLLLEDFSQLLNKSFNANENFFCGHNIKEFDIPYICRRMIINGMPLPPALQINGKKPWEVNILDTLDFWKFGDYKNYTSLRLLSTILGITSPKDDIDGSQVAKVYYQQHDLPRIALYCQKDVVATAQVWRRLNGQEKIDEQNIIIVE